MNDVNYLNPDFAALWKVCALDTDSYIDSNGARRSKLAYVDQVGHSVVTNMARYKAVQTATGVPWYLIGAIHFKESSLNFRTMLHNGEPLNIRSRIVPVGVGPFPSWEIAAVDALKREGCLNVKIWSPGECLRFAESYNGTGYRKRGILSPYVFGFTNLSDEKGGYPTDHVWSSTYPYRRPGVAAIMKWILTHA